MARKVKGLSFYTKKSMLSKSLIHEIFSWGFAILISVIMGLIVTFALGFSTKVLGVSMKPTLNNGQKVLINRVVYNVFPPKRGDVVVFQLHAVQESNYYIKRIIGVPGDTIQIIDGRIYINNDMYMDGFDKMADPGIAVDPIVLGEKEFFVLGDNRNNSEDSRNSDIGLVNQDMITGKVWFAMAAGVNGMSLIE